MDQSDSNWKFTNNHMVVITSNMAISMFSWKYYLEKNWNSIMEPNTRLLILGGIHGGEDGSLGKVDQNIENQTRHQIKRLKEDMKTEIEDFEVTILYERVGDYLDKKTWKPKPEELAQAIVKHQPTMLLLAFCYTSQSILNDTLRSQGLYSLLIMQKERETITRSRCIFLDQKQKDALLEIAKKQPKLVMIQGNFGTGKTILLMEALRIKLSQYKESKQKVKVIVTSDTKQKALIEYLKNNYMFESFDIEYYDCLKDVKVNDDLGIVGQINSIADMNACVRRIKNSVNKNHQPKTKDNNKRLTVKAGKVILVIDEFFIKVKQDWNKFETHPTVDVLIAFHPRKDKSFQFVPPKTEKSNVFCCSLDTMYRNSYEVLRFCSFLSSHASIFSKSTTAKIYPLLDPKKIEMIKSKLPEGQTPVWIELENEQHHPVTIFRYIRLKYLRRATKVSFIIDDSHTHSEEVKTWLSENGYQQHTTSEFAQVAFSFEHSMRGLEDEVNILVASDVQVIH